MSHGLRVLLRAGDPVRRQGLAAMLEAAGHTLVSETPDVVLCDLARDAVPPGEAEAPVVVLTDRSLPGEQPAGVLPRDGHRGAARCGAAGGRGRAAGAGAGRHCQPMGSAPPARTRRRC